MFAKPRVAILSTGNEVVEPGTPLAPGQIFDVNRFTLGAVVAAHGGVAEPQRPAQDTLDALIDALDACAERGRDRLLGRQFGRRARSDRRPRRRARRDDLSRHRGQAGQADAFALVDGAPFFGMPGNPTSCLSNAYILLVPFLRATARLPPYAPRTVSAPLGRRIVSPAGRHQFYTVRLARRRRAIRRSKARATSPACRRPTATSRFPADQSVVEEGTVVEVTLF